MKQTVDQKIETVLDIAPNIVPKTTTIVAENTTVDDDYEYARKNLRSLIDNGKDVMDNLAYLAKEGESRVHTRC